MTGLISDTFTQLKTTQQKAIIPFLTAHFPTRPVFNDYLHQLGTSGATHIEVGIPFTDPMADGVVIQRSSERAIQNGFNMTALFDDIRAFKARFPHIPIICMTYLNPLVAYGMTSWVTTAHAHGVDGLLLVDLPPENHHHIFPSPPPLDIIRLVTATTSPERLATIQKTASGFLYYVSVKGVTGTKTPEPTDIKAHFDQLTPHLKWPMVIGFGINSKDAAVAMAALSDGIVIGSHMLHPFLDAAPNDYPAIIDQQVAFLSSIKTELIQAKP